MYLKIGKLCAMALVHEGASFRIFYPCVYRFLCGRNACDLIASVNEVPDIHVQSFLKEVCKMLIHFYISLKLM